MTREKIKLEDLLEVLKDGWDKQEKFNIITCWIEDFDSEKGFTTNAYIFQRKSDKKYFKLIQRDFGIGRGEYDTTVEEVFPKITTTFE